MASVFVGTYHKYNTVGAVGQWLDLEKYADHEEFIEACRELHSDEKDPELHFQDYENFPEHFYSECSISPSLWDYLALSDFDKEVYEAYTSHCGTTDFDSDWESAKESYQGQFDSMEEFAESMIEEGLFGDIPDNLLNYLDLSAMARDLGYDYFMENGHVFRNL